MTGRYIFGAFLSNRERWVMNRSVLKVLVALVAVGALATPAAFAGNGTLASDFSNGHIEAHTSSPSSYHDSKKFTFSVWVKPHSLGIFNQGFVVLYRGGTAQTFNTRFAVKINYLGQVFVTAADQSGNTIIDLRTVNSVITAGSWNHILISCDLNFGVQTGARMYVNDVKCNLTGVSAGAWVVNGVIDFNTTNFYSPSYAEYVVGVRDGGLNHWSHCQSERWLFTDQHIDLDNVSERRKFIDATLKPEQLNLVNDGDKPLTADPDDYSDDGITQKSVRGFGWTIRGVVGNCTNTPR